MVLTQVTMRQMLFQTSFRLGPDNGRLICLSKTHKISPVPLAANLTSVTRLKEVEGSPVLIRPLIETSRHEIEKYLVDEKLQYHVEARKGS